MKKLDTIYYTFRSHYQEICASSRAMNSSKGAYSFAKEFSFLSSKWEISMYNGWKISSYSAKLFGVWMLINASDQYRNT